MGTRLYVGNLSYNVTEPELREVFAEDGRNVVEVKIVMDRDTGRPRGFAFVEMGSDDEASKAIQSLTGREVSGRAINVSEARERTPRSGAVADTAAAAGAAGTAAAAAVAARGGTATAAARWRWRRIRRRRRWPRWPRWRWPPRWLVEPRSRVALSAVLTGEG